MGLDMYLRGEKFFWTNWKRPEGQRRPMVDGFEKSNETLQLGYWRKHPNLHGFIVNTFAGGVDECQRIDLSVDDCKKIVEAIETDALPHTDGFFFGASDGSEKQESIAIFQRAMTWAEGRNKDESRDIYYQASW